MSLHGRDPSVQFNDSIRSLAERYAKRALARWVAEHPENAYEARLALSFFECDDIRDHSDDHEGEPTFSAFDLSAPDQYYLCARDWCTCEVDFAERVYCRHRIAVRLLLNYRAQYAKLYQGAAASDLQSSPTKQAPHKTEEPPSAQTPDGPSECPTPDRSPKFTRPKGVDLDGGEMTLSPRPLFVDKKLTRSRQIFNERPLSIKQDQRALELHLKGLVTQERRLATIH